MLYGRRWKPIIGLLVLWAAGLGESSASIPADCAYNLRSACEILSVYTEFTLHESTNLNSNRLKPWITSMLTITMALNLTATGASSSVLRCLERNF